MKIKTADINAGVSSFELVSDSAKLDLERYFPYRGRVTVEIDANRIGTELYLHATVRGRAHLVCDRCLAEFDREFTEKVLWIYTTQTELLEGEQDDVFLFDPEEDIDVSAQVRELLIVILPIQSLCKEDCKGLCAGCGADLNVEQCTCGEKAPDPRWGELSKLKENMKK